MTQPDVVDPGPTPSPDIPITEVPSAWISPSFWITMLPVISAVVGYFLHRQVDLSGQSAAIGLIAASVASGLLAISRALRHKAVLVANTAAQSMRLEHLHFDQVRALERQRLEVRAMELSMPDVQTPVPAKRTSAKKTTPRARKA